MLEVYFGLVSHGICLCVDRMHTVSVCIHVNVCLCFLWKYSCNLLAFANHCRTVSLNPPCLFNLAYSTETLVSDHIALKLSLSLSLLTSLLRSFPPTVIPPVSRNAVVFNFSQLLWLAAQPPAFPHLFPIRPQRSPHKQSLSPWPPNPLPGLQIKTWDCSPVPWT